MPESKKLCLLPNWLVQDLREWVAVDAILGLLGGKLLHTTVNTLNARNYFICYYGDSQWEN